MEHKPGSSRKELPRPPFHQGWDQRIQTFIKNHINLLILVLLLVITAWGMESDHLAFVLGLICIGAISYFQGLALAMVIGVVWSGLDLYTWSKHGFIISQILIEFVSNALIAWLGYAHKEQSKIQKQKQAVTSHVDPVLPWAVANEIRTSLAAVRYLLFPLEQDSQYDVHTATSELTRMEELFSELEKKQHQRAASSERPHIEKSRVGNS